VCGEERGESLCQTLPSDLLLPYVLHCVAVQCNVLQCVAVCVKRSEAKAKGMYACAYTYMCVYV